MTLALLTAVALAASPGRALPTVKAPLPEGASVRPADPSAPAALRLALVLHDRAALDTLIAQQRDPASPLFRRWLTPEEFGARFGVSQRSYDALCQALARAGLEVKRFPNRLYVEGVGTVGQLQALLGVKELEVEADGKQFRTYQGEPRLPAELAALVRVAYGLDTRGWMHRRLDVGGGTNTMGPQDLRRYYNIEPLHQQGYTGQLSKVAMIGTVPDSTNAIVPDEVNWFYKNVSDSSAQLHVITLPLNGSQPDSQQSLKIELEMDVELPTVAAPQVQSVTAVLAPQDALFVAALNEINNNHPDLTAVSISFGSCELAEQQFNAAEIPATADLVAQGAAEGIAFFSASGDDGVTTCAQTGIPSIQNQPSVDFPSGIPYMTAVGGTMYQGTFNANNAIDTWGDEVTWNEQGQAAGGGGVSVIFTRPVWQVGPGTTDGGYREVPDFALVSATTPGVAIVSTRPGAIDPWGSGTSDAAPMAAGIFALVNDRIGGCRVGAPNPELYALGAAQYGAGGAAVFHDITQGNISLNGVTGPSAHAAYDEATGLGSLDVTALAGAWAACPLAPLTQPDAGSADAGVDTDAGADLDAGPADVDAGDADAGLVDQDAGAADAGSVDVDAGDVDAGSAPVDAGPADAGYQVIPWDGGYAQDAGPRSAYDPCAIIACDGGAVCTTIVEGPSQCLFSCDPSGANTCGAGNHCAATDAGAGYCTPGCGADSDCTGNQVCNACSGQCVAPGNAGASVGDTCSADTDCQTGGYCLPGFWGFPNGYCSADCSTCGCPGNSECRGGFCLSTCSVSAQTGCRSGYVCDPTDTTDVGVCLPDCRTGGCFNPNATCNTSNGICEVPGTTNATTASSSASSSSGATSGSSGTGGTTAGTTGSASSTGGTTSSGSASTATSGSSGSAGSTGGSTGAASTGATSAAGSSGSTGSTGSGSTTKKGCGCGTGAGLEGLFGLLAAAGTLRRRRR